MAKQKFYAVKIGRKKGIFYTWDDCERQVKGYSGAKFKSFPTEEEARMYLNPPSRKATTKPKTAKQLLEIDKAKASKQKKASQTKQSPSAKTKKKKTPRKNVTPYKNYAYVDGSFNAKEHRYGYGGFLIANNRRYQLQGSGVNPEMARMHNVAGEILGAMAAIEQALLLHLTELTIYYDYKGIECWANEEWKANKTGTINYKQYVKKAREYIKINFIKVKGHSGVAGNEEADRLAKQAVGLGGVLDYDSD